MAQEGIEIQEMVTCRDCGKPTRKDLLGKHRLTHPGAARAYAQSRDDTLAKQQSMEAAEREDRFTRW